MITLNLTLEQTNLILNALSEMPFKVSAEIINKIHEQAAPQVAESEEKKVKELKKEK